MLGLLLHLRHASSCAGNLALALPWWRCWFCYRGLSINLLPCILISHLVDSLFPYSNTIGGEVLIYYAMLSSKGSMKMEPLVADKTVCHIFIGNGIWYLWAECSWAQASVKCCWMQPLCLPLTLSWPLWCSPWLLQPCFPSCFRKALANCPHFMKKLPFNSLIALHQILFSVHWQCLDLYVKSMVNILWNKRKLLLGPFSGHVGSEHASGAWGTLVPVPTTWLWVYCLSSWNLRLFIWSMDFYNSTHFTRWL